MFINQLMASVGSIVRNGPGRDGDRINIRIFYGHLDETTRRVLNGMSTDLVKITTAAFND